MLNSTTWLYGAEVLPIALRSKVMGLAAASHFIVNVASASSAPSICIEEKEKRKERADRYMDSHRSRP